MQIAQEESKTKSRSTKQTIINLLSSNAKKTKIAQHKQKKKSSDLKVQKKNLKLISPSKLNQKHKKKN